MLGDGRSPDGVQPQHGTSRCVDDYSQASSRRVAIMAFLFLSMT
jgi:hypothetical protein